MSIPVSYEEIRNSSPTGCRTRKKHRKLSAWQSLLFFAVIMTLMLLFGGLFYMLTGSMYLESLAEQLFFLCTSVVFVLLMRGDLKEVFPFRKPKAGALCGVLVLLLVSFLAAEIFSLLALHFAPGSLEEASENMEELLSAPSLPAELLIACFCPAICEEALHRGVVLNGLRSSIPDSRIVIFLGGLFFGLFHVYPVRMIMPAFIGMLMSWLLLKTDNMLYGCLLHFGYNTVLILLSRTAEEAAGTADAGVLTPGFTGLSVMTAGIFIPILLHLGMWLVRRVTEPRIPEFIPVQPFSSSVFARVLIPTVCFVIFGLLLYNGIV